MVSKNKKVVDIVDDLFDGDILDNNLEELEELEELEIDSKDVVYERKGVEDILFRLPIVDNPLIGTPKEVQKELDNMAVKIRKKPNSFESELLFNRIHLYMHGYLINIALKQFPYIKGLQTVDIYQESLIALKFKAIPGFKKRKRMSFLNFAKMCIRRHLITKLNAANEKQKDKSLNTAFSIDGCPYGSEDSGNTFANTIADEKIIVDKKAENDEAYMITLRTLMLDLSEFEKSVLLEHLEGSSYNQIATEIDDDKKRSNMTKAVDNALVRIRKKAKILKKTKGDEDLPIFMI